MVRNLRFSDLYRNVAQYLKRYECTDDFTGTRAYLESLFNNPAKVDTVIMKIKAVGASCDCEIISKVKPLVNGRRLLVVIE